MRFAFVSVAILALAHSLAPGVHGAPAVVSDHTNSLAVRQVPSSLVNAIVAVLESVLALGSSPIPSGAAGQLAQQFAQELQKSVASGLVLRAPSSDSTSSVSSTSFTTLSSTTTSHVLPVSTDQIATSTVSSVSLSTPQASSTPPTRMRRQLPSALPTSLLSLILSIASSQTASLPAPSVAASVLSAVPSKLGSVSSQSAASKPTPSNPSVSTSRV